MVLRGEVFGRQMGHEIRDFIIYIKDYKRDPKESPLCFCQERLQPEATISELERELSQDAESARALIEGFPLRSCKEYISVVSEWPKIERPY